MEFTFGIPANVRFGAGVSSQLGSIVVGLGARKVFAVYDKGVKAAGLVDPLLDGLRTQGLEVIGYDEVLANPPDVQIESAAQLARSHAPDVLVAIGGGSAMDSAKAINILLTNPSPIQQYEGFNKVQQPVLYLIAIPTTAGTASEVTNVSVVTDTRRIRKMVIGGQHVSASLALADPLLTLGMPPAITAATGMDALTHAIEAFVSRAAMPPTDAMALPAIELITGNLVRAHANGQDLEARSAMLLGSLMAGFAFNSAVLGLAHSIAHPLSAHFHLPHGVANAIVLPYVMAYNAPVAPQKFRRIAQAMGIDTQGLGDEDAATAAVRKVTALNAVLGMPRLTDCGIRREHLARLATDALLEASTPFNPRTPSHEDVLGILEQAL